MSSSLSARSSTDVQARLVKAAVNDALQSLKDDFPGHLQDKLQQKLAICLPVLAESMSQLLDSSDDRDLQVL